MSNIELEKNFSTIVRDDCYKLHYGNNSTYTREGFCEALFDGFICWPFTRARELAIQPCFHGLVGSSTRGNASRQCTENATWLIPENSTSAWSNLTQCGQFYFTVPTSTEVSPGFGHLYADWISFTKNISYFGYAISIVSLITALCILINIKRLHCARNKLHINLFLSFIMRYFMTILKDGLFVKGTALEIDTKYVGGQPQFSEEQHYSWLCKAIISIRYYFILSNFMLMLMEGVYLHHLMFLNLFSDNHGITIYCLIGWGLPVLFIVPWVILMITYQDLFCWTKETRYILFINLPIGITVVINLLLFIVIVRVLILKLNNARIQQRHVRYRKLLKATLILIPLFGVPYSLSLLMSFYSKTRPTLEVIYIFFDQTFTAFQGLFAALVYCLLNSEVQTEIKRKYSSLKDRTDKEFRRSRTISNTQQFSMQPNDELPENLHLFANGKQNPQEIIITDEHHCYV